MSIESISTVENYMMKKDQITSRAEGLLLPGFEVVEVGYGPKDSRQVWNDNTYKVTLVGKVKVDKEAIKKEENRRRSESEFELGEQCYKNKDYTCARDHFERAISLDNNNFEYKFNLAQSQRWLGKDFFDKALENYNNCVKNDYRKGDSYACIASIFASKYYHGQSKNKVKEAYEKGAALGNSYCIEGLSKFEEICKANDM